MKHFFEIVEHIKATKKLKSVHDRVKGSTREGDKSMLFKLFSLVFYDNIDKDTLLSRKLYGKTSPAYFNLKRRLFAEMLSALGTDLVQSEDNQSYFVMRVIAVTHLRNAHVLWQQTLHKAALTEFEHALDYAEKSHDVYLLAHIRHQLMVLSTFDPKTVLNIEIHYNEINKYFEQIPYFTELCMMYYKVRYAEQFAKTPEGVKKIYLSAVMFYKRMLKESNNLDVKLQVLNGLINCYEKLFETKLYIETLQKYLELSKPLMRRGRKDFKANRKLLEGKYYEAIHEFSKFNEAVNDESLNEFEAVNKSSFLAKLRSRNMPSRRKNVFKDIF
jgi:tetratricopeptide (TPR) repeat protein